MFFPKNDANCILPHGQDEKYKQSCAERLKSTVSDPFVIYKSPSEAMKHAPGPLLVAAISLQEPYSGFEKCATTEIQITEMVDITIPCEKMLVKLLEDKVLYDHWLDEISDEAKNYCLRLIEIKKQYLRNEENSIGGYHQHNDIYLQSAQVDAKRAALVDTWKHCCEMRANGMFDSWLFNSAIAPLSNIDRFSYKRKLKEISEHVDPSKVDAMIHDLVWPCKD